MSARTTYAFLTRATRGKAGRAGGCAPQAATARAVRAVLTSIGNGLLALRGFEPEGEEEWLCDWVANGP